MSKKLWYKKPADKWVDGLPLGNGTLGAMVLGNVFNERLSLNEDTLWTGFPKDKTNYSSKDYLEEVRNLIDNEKYYEAQEIINEKMLSSYTESYAPLGDLLLDFYYKDNSFSNYSRELDLEKALVIVKYNVGNIEIKREAFVSAEDKVLVMKITSREELALNFDIRLKSLLKSKSYKDGEAGLKLTGITPIDNLPSYTDNKTIIYDEEGKLGTKFCGRLRVKNTNGDININEEILEVRNATEVVLILSASTNFEEFNVMQDSLGRNEEALSKIIINKASKLSYNELFSNHLKEYSELFSRVDFKLGEEVAVDNKYENSSGQAISKENKYSEGQASDNGYRYIDGKSIDEKYNNGDGQAIDKKDNDINGQASNNEDKDNKGQALNNGFKDGEGESLNNGYKDIDGQAIKINKELLTTDERLERLKSGEEDLALITLYFHYGRYLLISSSRSGSEPANLQGIWNEDVKPAWSSNYTININTEMNYWPAEVCNLPECHEPLLNMIKDLSVSGVRTAREEFNCNGWTANHNSDIWRYSNKVLGNCEWGYWPMGGPWLCQHIFEHYDFTRDKEFLKEYYPVLKGSAEFLLSWLKEDENGILNTCPSTSPENNFLDNEKRPCAASKSSTMDIAIIRDLFTNVIKASEELNIEADFREKIKTAMDKLPKYKINKFGGIQEWFKDFEEKEPGHRHISHLFGLYPGKEITEYKNEALIEGCKNTLSRRLAQGGGHTGWSCAWIINFYARLKDSNLAYKYLKTLLNKLTYPNLFCVHPPFQIDGNFGGTAGIAEMLIQSHTEYIEILPAIPKEWKTGEVKGLKARGGFIVDIAWEDNKLSKLKIKAIATGTCNIKYRRNLEDSSEVEELSFLLEVGEVNNINI
ncbi:glycoside hydrolase family 95 protein [Clostridium sp.]|uniref:glycoside hydrolase family 95 protein n=1 Tax=Clostridium sp. TaxID=1506 RepID=UPI002908E29F|nr:glycoside hydrolase family 95 protein [Clostridium sp.]MDU5107794.1 glycoside hydrolase family 95 protein [Clostridium sp.]